MKLQPSGGVKRDVISLDKSGGEDGERKIFILGSVIKS
jgi:hypothetical protein